MTNARLDAVIALLIRACGAPRLRLTPRMLAKHLGIPHQAAKDGLRRAARKGLLQGGRVPEEMPEEAIERAAREAS